MVWKERNLKLLCSGEWRKKDIRKRDSEIDNDKELENYRETKNGTSDIS